MSQDEIIVLLFKIVLLSNLAAIFAFVMIYTALAPWWRNVIGRSIVTLDILLGMAFLPSTISLFWQFNRLTSYIAAWMDIGIFTLIAAGMTWRCVMWVRIHRKGRSNATAGDVEELGSTGDCACRVRRAWRLVLRECQCGSNNVQVGASDSNSGTHPVHGDLHDNR